MVSVASLVVTLSL